MRGGAITITNMAFRAPQFNRVMSRRTPIEPEQVFPRTAFFMGRIIVAMRKALGEDITEQRFGRVPRTSNGGHKIYADTMLYFNVGGTLQCQVQEFSNNPSVSGRVALRRMYRDLDPSDRNNLHYIDIPVALHWNVLVAQMTHRMSEICAAALSRDVHEIKDSVFEALREDRAMCHYIGNSHGQIVNAPPSPGAS